MNKEQSELISQLRKNIEGEVSSLTGMITTADYALRIAKLGGLVVEQDKWSHRKAVCETVLKSAQTNLDLTNALDSSSSEDDLEAVILISCFLIDARKAAMRGLE